MELFTLFGDKILIITLVLSCHNVKGIFECQWWFYSWSVLVERCYRLGVISCNEPSFGNIGEEQLLAQTRNTIQGNKLSQIFQTISQIFAKKWIFWVEISWSSNPMIEHSLRLPHIDNCPLNRKLKSPLSIELIIISRLPLSHSSYIQDYHHHIGLLFFSFLQQNKKLFSLSPKMIW